MTTIIYPYRPSTTNPAPDLPYQNQWLHPVYPHCNCDHCRKLRGESTIQFYWRDHITGESGVVEEDKPDGPAMRADDV